MLLNKQNPDIAGVYDLIYMRFFIFVDIRRVNSQAVHAANTGMIILGGGVVKHHICNANLMVRLI